MFTRLLSVLDTLPSRQAHTWIEMPPWNAGWTFTKTLSLTNLIIIQMVYSQTPDLDQNVYDWSSVWSQIRIMDSSWLFLKFLGRGGGGALSRQCTQCQKRNLILDIYKAAYSMFLWSSILCCRGQWKWLQMSRLNSWRLIKKCTSCGVR